MNNERKTPVRRTALQVCQDYEMTLLKAQLLCMSEGELELKAATADMLTRMATAMDARATRLTQEAFEKDAGLAPRT